MTRVARGTGEAERGGRSAHLVSRWPFLRPLVVRDFRLLWLGEGVSLLGDQFYFVALTWLTLQVSGSALALATVLMVATVPRAALMLLGGAVTDRYSPRRVMLLSNAIRAVLVAALTALILGKAIHIWELYPFAFVFGIIDAVFYPAANAIVPLLVDEGRLAAGTALTLANYQTTGLIGPTRAGLVIARLGTGPGTAAAFAFDAVSFAFAATMLALIHGGIRSTPSSGETGPTKDQGVSSLLRSIAEGLRYAAKDPVIRSLLIIVAAVDFASGGLFNVGIASLAHVRFAGSAVAFGAMLSASGAGSLLGVVLGGSLPRLPRRGLIAVGVVTGFGIGYALLGFVPTLSIALVVIAVMGFGSGLSNVVMLPWLQLRTAPEMMGRVVSLFTFASVALSPLSYPVAGVLADKNVALDFIAASVIVIVAAMFAGANATVRQIE